MSDQLALARSSIEGFGLSVSSLSASCPGCGAVVPEVPNGPTHPYLGASPGCWTLYTALLSREYTSFDAEVHRLSVDTYAVQHPGAPSPQATQSMCVHLVSLCLAFEHGWEMSRIRGVMGDMSKGRFFTTAWLGPPTHTYPVTIVNLLDEDAPDAYGEAVRRWARSTWDVWEAHHNQIRAWALQVTSAGHRSRFT